MGRRNTHATELLHADLNLGQAVVVLELRELSHIASRSLGDCTDQSRREDPIFFLRYVL